ncbi:O-antigen ligase family protein [Oceanibaculum pacificum]|uniref:O-antigen ligase-related domain-containing protein n=1 Tax=Oceanibaculum pacificum TaxID=580166 RepID=A0A154VH05_9PROT|nr:O-antigen ligase family protein [Oceanibaculum pacificum]KZD00612.1 hypothetical protein AUP43_14320 [Oceanibaculum pacificum]
MIRGIGPVIFAWLLALGLLLAWSPRVVAVGLLAAAIIGIALYALNARRLPIPRHPAAWAVALFVLYACLTALWSAVPDSAHEQVRQFLLLYIPSLLFLQMLLVVRLDGDPLVRRGLLLGLGLGLGLFALEMLTGQPLYHLTRGIPLGEPLGANSINRPAALCALLVWPLALSLWQGGNRRIAIALPLLLSALVLCSSSQSAAGGLLLGLVFLGIAAASRRAAFHLAAAGMIIGFLGMVPIAHLLSSLGLASVEGLPFSMGHRVLIWDFVADRVAERPIFGWGLEASRGLNDIGAAPPALFSGTVELLPLHPHNAFLQIWLELGGVGAVLALAMALGVLRAVRGLPPTAQIFAYPLLTCGFFMSGTAYGIWQTWWMAGFLSAAALFIVAMRCGANGARHGQA